MCVHVNAAIVQDFSRTSSAATVWHTSQCYSVTFDYFCHYFNEWSFIIFCYIVVYILYYNIYCSVLIGHFNWLPMMFFSQTVNSNAIYSHSQGRKKQKEKKLFSRIIQAFPGICCLIFHLFLNDWKIGQSFPRFSRFFQDVKILWGWIKSEIQILKLTKGLAQKYFHW